MSNMNIVSMPGQHPFGNLQGPSFYIPKIFRISNPASCMDIVRKGDVLITGRVTGIGLIDRVGFIGHAAIMADDTWVLEMQGGAGWQNGIPDNNRRVDKYDWYREHSSDQITLYRNRNSHVATLAADWAYRTYYNSRGGSRKTKHITYRITPDIWSTDPSYCSKLVIQAYHFGTGDRDVIKDFSLLNSTIVPTTIPNYFKSPYTLVKKKTFNEVPLFFPGIIF